MDAKSLAPLGLGILIPQMGGADMLFERKLAAVPLSTTNAIPSLDLFGCREVCVTASKPFLSLVHGADVDSQVSFLGKTAATAVDGAGKDLPLFETDIAVSYLKMASQFSRCRADDGTVGAFGRVNGSNVFLKNGVCGKRHRIIVGRVKSAHVGCLLLQAL